MKIKAYLAQKKYTTAVETFNQALDLVFTDKLVAFHALTGLRTSLMECKQIIEDDLVQALLNITFLKVKKMKQHILKGILSHLCLGNHTKLPPQIDRFCDYVGTRATQ